jgi:hypothetical protein
VSTAGSKHLKGLICNQIGGLGHQDLDLRSQEGIRKRISAEGSLMQREPSRVESDRHVSQHPLKALEFGNWPAELLALLGERDSLLEGALGDPQRHRPGPTRWLL